MTLRIDVVQGADGTAPGLSRAREPLLAELELRPDYSLRRLQLHSTSARMLFFYMYGPLPARLWLDRPDLVHIASGWYAHLVPLIPAPVVVTCHDLIEIGGRSTMKPHRRFHLSAALRGLQRADRIVCDSHAVAQQLRSYAPALAPRVRVVHLGIGSAFTPAPVREAALSALGVRRPYVLYVGSEQPRKNLVRLVEALAVVRRRFPTLQFVKVGHSQTPDGRDTLMRALERTGSLPHTLILESVTDTHLIELYRGARATALVSLQEGFGFPPLEAMACGCPAIVSSAGPLPEVTAGAALVVDPLDTDSIAGAITSIMCDDTARANLIAPGLQRAKHFSWQRAAREYASIYAEAAGTT
ncbi:MAG: glycosyltransferase family 1 protein [Chloroflexota bacterium]